MRNIGRLCNFLPTSPDRYGKVLDRKWPWAEKGRGQRREGWRRNKRYKKQ